MKKRTIILLFLTFLIVCCCTNQHSDHRLTLVEKLAETDPKMALDSLNRIDYNNLSDADRQYYDFLTIKVKDKAFVAHTSDSLILKVIKNEEKNQNRGRYAEALYYGGRVCHDLGDYPTALNYYHNALEKNPSKKLEGCIVIQIGSILNSLRLYEQAIPYIKRAIAIDSCLHDSINLVYDIDHLGAINIHTNNFENAELLFNKAKKIAKISLPSDTTIQNIYLAGIKYRQGDLNSALSLIRPSLQNVDSNSRNLALAYACEIYKAASINDTLFVYAHELINSSINTNRKIGYMVLLSEGMKDYTPVDSLIKYAADYTTITEEYLDQNGNQEALIQNSYYNYHIHQRERIKAEEKNRNLNKCIIFILLASLTSIAILLYFKNRYKSRLLQLYKAINDIKKLHNELDKATITTTQLTTTDTESQNIQDLRIKLRDELLSIRNNNSHSYAVPSIILESQTYEQIIHYINSNSVIPTNSHIWDDLETLVVKTSPNFKYNLRLLTGGNLKPTDLRLALLIKCNISPTNISTLVGRAKATIAYQRKNLCMKVYDQYLDAGTIDDIIRLL